MEEEEEKERREEGREEGRRRGRRRGRKGEEVKRRRKRMLIPCYICNVTMATTGWVPVVAWLWLCEKLLGWENSSMELETSELNRDVWLS